MDPCNALMRGDTCIMHPKTRLPILIGLYRNAILRFSSYVSSEALLPQAVYFAARISSDGGVAAVSSRLTSQGKPRLCIRSLQNKECPGGQKGPEFGTDILHKITLTIYFILRKSSLLCKCLSSTSRILQHQRRHW